MMEAVQTSETLVNSYQSARRYNPEDSHLDKRSLQFIPVFLQISAGLYVKEFTMFCCFSASPSKLKAKLAIAGIWCVAAALAAPMAAALRVTYIEDPDPSKFW
jgi:hypothetical protein